MIKHKLKNTVIIVVFSIILQLLLSINIFSLGEETKSYSSKIRILPLGNSITFDSRSNDTRAIGDKAGYRYPLYNLLKSANVNFSFVGSEHSGGNYLPAGYDNSAGFPGLKDEELLLLLKTGRLFQPYNGTDVQITHGKYLDFYPADIILLHIGTNGNDEATGTSADDIEKILDHIDSISTDITVVLALIIDRVPNQSFVTELNNNIKNMALDRINNPANDAYPDKIVLVDMQKGVGINYTIDSMGTIGDGKIGDMNDHLHPNNKGYAKMANMWFDAISTVIDIPPSITKQPNNINLIAGQTAKFEVKSIGTKPFTYQWKKNGINIQGATDSIYQISSVQPSDNGLRFSCSVSNAFGIDISNEVTLSILGESERVEDGLQVLYTFEKNGNEIPDVSGVGASLNLTIGNSANIKNVPYGKEVFSPTILSANSTPTKIFNSCITTNEISIEAWIKPLNTTQTGPARIITFSKDGSNRNFTLGQIGNKFDTRVNTSTTDMNGVPSLSSTSGSLTTELTHIVYTRSSNGTAKIYINGVQNSSSSVAGNFSTWDDTDSFGLANEFITNRTWLGTYYLVPIYDKALSSDEVVHNYNAGFDGIDRLLFIPTDFVGTVKNDSLVELTWVDNCDDELGYIIERSANSVDSIYNVIDTVGANIISYTDYSTKHSTSYFYRIKAYNAKYVSDYSDTLQVDNIVGGIQTEKVIDNFRLYQNYPNPFNPITTIKYRIPSDVKRNTKDGFSTTGIVGENVTLKIYNILGKEVATLINKQQKPGTYTVNFDASNLPASRHGLSSGVYYYQLRTNSYVETKKMVLLQ